MRKHLIVGVLSVFALFSWEVSARAGVYINNRTDVEIQYQFMQQGQNTWSNAKLKPWASTDFANQDLQVRFKSGAELKTYKLQPRTSYGFKVTTAGTIDLFTDPKPR
jgi:hypothetical protein